MHQGITSIADEFESCENLTSVVVYANTDAEFTRIKDLLPEKIKHCADLNGKQTLERILSPLKALLSKYPGGIEKEPDLEEINQIMDAANIHLEQINPNLSAYTEQKKLIDTLFIETLVHQGDTSAALTYFLENPAIDKKLILLLASELTSFKNIEPQVKHQAFIALFKDHTQIDGMSLLLTQSALYLLSGKEPKLSDTLSTHGIEKCAPLSVLRSTAQDAITGLPDTNPLKEKLDLILRQCEHLTRQEILHLFSLPPLQEAFANNAALGSALILPFESLYRTEPPRRELPDDPERFLSTTLQQF